MNTSRFATLSAVLLVAGCLQAQAQEADVKTELAAQGARITQLEEKAAAPFKFPDALTPYILIDTTIVAKTNATADGRTKVDMVIPYLSGSRWGLRGKIKTNIEGLNVLYKLESEYETPTGNMDTPNVLFNRDAWAGFSYKDWGQIQIGRQNTLARDFSVIYGDPFHHPEINYEEGGWTNTNNFKQLIYFAASVDGTRVNKGIVWKRVPTEGLAMGLAYNLTSTESDTSTRNSTACAALGYNAKIFHLGGYYSQANNNSFTQRSYSIGGNVDLSKVIRLWGGVFRYTADQGGLNPERTDTAYTVSVSVHPHPNWTYFLAFQSMKANDAGLTAAGFMQNPFSDGSASTLFGTGRKDTTYGAIFRHLSRRMEAYVIFDYMTLHDGYRLSGTNGHNNQLEVGLGFRIRAL